MVKRSDLQLEFRFCLFVSIGVHSWFQVPGISDLETRRIQLQARRRQVSPIRP